MKTKKPFILLLSLLLLSINTFSQTHTKFEIVQDKKGKFSLIDKQTGDIVNKYQKCTRIDSIHSLEYPTNPKYKDYLLIQKGKTFVLFNRLKEKALYNLTFDGPFSISIYELRLDVNEIQFGRLNPNTVRNYSNIQIVGKKGTTSLLYNFDSEKFISAFTTPNYSSPAFFELIKEDLILASVGETIVVIDSSGKKIVPMMTGPFFKHFNGGFAYADDNFKFGVVNYQGDTIAPFVYEKAESSQKDNFVILENSERKAGVINAQGKIAIPFIYRPKHPNYYRAYSYSDYGVFMLYKSNFEDSNFVFVDTNGVELIKEASYQNAWKLWIPYESSYNNRYYFVENEKVGVFDTKQKKEIIPCKYGFYKEKDDTKFGVISARDEKGNWGLLSLEDGSIIIPFEYESAKSEFIYTRDGIASFILSKGGKFGIIYYKGETQLPFEYSKISKTKYDNFAIVEKDGLYGLFDLRTSGFVIPIELKAIDKYLRLEKLENGKLLNGEFDVEKNLINWRK